MEYVTKCSNEPGWTSSERQRRIVKFLTGIDYMPGAEKKIENVIETKVVGANRDAITAGKASFFLDDEELNFQQMCNLNKLKRAMDGIEEPR